MEGKEHYEGLTSFQLGNLGPLSIEFRGRVQLLSIHRIFQPFRESYIRRLVLF